MKKIIYRCMCLTMLLTFMLVVVSANAQDKRTIYVTTCIKVYGKGYTDDEQYFELYKDGKYEISHGEFWRSPFGYNAFSKRIDNEGTYYIDELNVIHMTRPNGYVETAKLSYDSNGNITILYNDKYYRQN